MGVAAYLVARVDVQDKERYAEYMRHTPRVVNQYGGRFVARSPEAETLEGPAETRRVVVIEFPSADDARAFFDSPEYTAVKRLREGAAEGQFILVDGYPIDDWESALEASQQLPPP